MLVRGLLFNFFLFAGVSLVGAETESFMNSMFQAVVIDDDLPRAYQVAIADIDNDGRPDLAALGEGRESRVAWYENPSWKKRSISGTETRNHIDLAFYDLDSDGELEVALASDFNLGETSQGGTVSWLDRQGDIERPWTVNPIHREPTAHRIRWANVDGDGRKELINLPVVGNDSKPPRYSETPVRLLAYTIPKDSRRDPWPVEVIDQSLHIAHGIAISDFDGNGWDDILTASVEGVSRFFRIGTAWHKDTLCVGLTGEELLTGSSEVSMGRLSDGGRFLATIDPWHGHQVAVYSREQADTSSFTKRILLDDSFDSGHAIACADFDGDNSDEIIAGYRGKGFTVYLYDYNNGEWHRSVISKDVAAQGFAVGDMNGDGKLDFAATGGTTHNVVLFLNQ